MDGQVESPQARQDLLQALLSPRSVAIVGASDDPTRIGGRPIAYMQAAGYQGRILPVNLRHAQVQGLPAVPRVADLEGPLDFAVIAVPADSVNQALRDCAAKGARACLVFSSGFAEASEAGAALQAEMRCVVAETGLRVIGPNCLGAFNAHSGFIACFSTTLDRGPPLPGGLSIASQSGAYGSHIYYVARTRGVGVAKVVTTGNEVDLDVAEIIGLLAEDPETHCIAAYAEGVTDGARLVESLELARAAGKPVIFMKVGRSAVGAEAARSHTAALAGEDAIYEAVLRQHGAWRARSTEEMLDIAYAARRRLFPAGRRLGLVTISGGAGVLMADAAADLGLEVPAMPADAQAELKRLLPFAAPRNPVDVTAQAFNDMSLVEANMRIMLERGGYDAILCFWTSVAGSTSIAGRLLEAFRKGAAGHRDSLILQSIVAAPEIVQAYEKEGYPVFEDPTRAVLAIAALLSFGRAFAAGRPERPPALALPPLPSGAPDEHRAKQLLTAAGLAFPAERVVTSPEEAAAAGEALGWPLVMKILSPDIPHKTEIGGVILDVRGAAAARQAYGTLLERAASKAPAARIAGVLAAEQLGGGVECILGAKHDPVFGPVVLFGLGGIFTEALGDVVFRRAPFARAEALSMLDEIKGRRVLDGLRGRPPADRESLAAALVALSRFAAAAGPRLESVDLNPVLALPDRVVALDALLVLRDGPASGPDD